MASKTVTDRGVSDAAVIFEKSGGALVCEVLVRDSAGVQYSVRVPIAGTLTAGEAAALPAVLLKLYAAALTAAGFTVPGV